MLCNDALHTLLSTSNFSEAFCCLGILASLVARGNSGKKPPQPLMLINICCVVTTLLLQSTCISVPEDSTDANLASLVTL